MNFLKIIGMLCIVNIVNAADYMHDKSDTYWSATLERLDEQTLVIYSFSNHKKQNPKAFVDYCKQKNSVIIGLSEDIYPTRKEYSNERNREYGFDDLEDINGIFNTIHEKIGKDIENIYKTHFLGFRKGIIYTSLNRESYGETIKQFINYNMEYLRERGLNKIVILEHDINIYNNNYAELELLDFDTHVSKI